MQENLGLFLKKRAELTPHHEAFVQVESGLRLTWSELDTRANRTANALHALGVRPGDRVALLLMNGPEMFESYAAIAKLGAIAVPLNWRLVPDELSFLLLDSGATALIYAEAFDGQVAELARRGAAGSQLRHWLRAGDDAALPGFARSYARSQAAASGAEPPIGAGGEADLLILYTSGTTGRPKGAVHTHRTAIWGATNFGVSLDLRYRDTWLLFMPAFHVGALNPFVSCVQRDVEMVVMRAFDPAGAWRAIAQERVTCFVAVPAMLNAMLPMVERGEVDASSVRWILTGGSPVPVPLLEAYAAHDISIIGAYGLTEAAGLGCLLVPDEARARIGSAGKPFFGLDLRVVDEKGRECAPGEPGEITLSGYSVMKGYWNLPEATAETIRGGWLHTGDVAARDSDGYVYIRDRLKDMIISGGENIYPAEIENLLAAHPDIFEVAVIGQPSRRWGESPFAVVVPKSPTLREQDVLDWCQGRLARFKQPRGVAFVAEIPRNPSGKVLKRALRERFPGPAPE
jgi:acyl-CoA synthetase (AMP-forming)/AMP-acid ligase II